MKIARIMLFYSALVLIVLSAPPAFPDTSFPVTVVEGDTLIGICNRYLEQPQRWREVAKANHLRNPDKIMPGQVIQIPVELLKGIPLTWRISSIRGDIVSRPEEKAEWKPLRNDDLVRQGAIIKISKGSSAELVYEDGSSLYLMPNAELVITDAREKGGIRTIRKFFLRAGRVITKVRGATGKESRFEIHTPSAVAAARGTEFRTSVDSSDATRSEVLHGIVGVEAMNKGVDLHEGEGTLVLKNKPPMSPRKLLRPPGLTDRKALQRNLPFALRFEAVKGAEYYRIILAADRGMGNTLKEKTIRPQEVFGIDDVEDGTYYLQSSSIDDIGLEGALSDPIELTVRVNPLPPIIQSPLDGTESRNRSVTMSWLKVADAGSYQIQISPEKNFPSTSEEKIVGIGTEFRTKELDFKTYYFRLRSIAADGFEGEWSDSRSFTIVPPPPAPSIEKRLVGKDELRFGWNNLGKGTIYHFQMAGDAAFNNLLADQKVDSPEIVLMKQLDPGTYYVRTSGIDSKGYEGKFSAPQSFEIEKRFPFEWVMVLGFIGLRLLMAL